MLFAMMLSSIERVKTIRDDMLKNRILPEDGDDKNESTNEGDTQTTEANSKKDLSGKVDQPNGDDDDVKEIDEEDTPTTNANSKKDLSGKADKPKGDDDDPKDIDETEDEEEAEESQPVPQGPSKVDPLLAKCNCPQPDASSSEYGSDVCIVDAFADRTQQYIQSYLKILKGTSDADSDDDRKPLKVHHQHGSFKIIITEEPGSEESADSSDNKCSLEVRSYKEDFKTFIVVFVFIYDSRSSQHSKAVELKTAVLFLPKDTKVYQFNERDIKSTKDIEKVMAGDTSDPDLDATPIDLLNLDRVVAVEISTRLYFDGKINNEKNLACQHTTTAFGRFFDLLKHLKVTDFDLDGVDNLDAELGYVSKEDFDKRVEASKTTLYDKFVTASQVRRNRQLMTERSLAQELSLLLTEVSQQLHQPKERRLETVADAKMLFVAQNFQDLFSDASNPLQWKNIRKLMFFVNSLYAEYNFKFIWREHACDGEDEYRQKYVLILNGDNKDLVSFSFDVTTPTEEDDNIHICLEVLGELGSSFLSSLNCYDLDPNAYNDPEEVEESVKKQKTDFWKILEMMIGNFADVIEDISMLIKTKLRPSSIRKLFYLLEVEQKNSEENNDKVSRIPLTKEDQEILGFIELDSPSNDHKKEAIEKKKASKPKSLVIESDPSGAHRKLKMKVSLPTDALSLPKKLKFLRISVDMFEDQYDSILLKLNAFDRNLEILISTYWFEEVSLRYSGSDHVISLNKYVGRSFKSHEEIRVMNEMLFAFLKSKVEQIIVDWIFEIITKKSDFDDDFDKPLQSLVPGSFWKPLSEFDISSFSEVGTLLYSLMGTCDFYDRLTNTFLLSDDAKVPSDDEIFNQEVLKNYKVSWEKITRSVQGGMSDDDDDSGPVSSFLTDDDISGFNTNQDAILNNLLNALSYLDTKQELGSVDFQFKTSNPEMGYFNEKNLSDEISIKVTFLEEYFWNSIHLYVSSAFFTAEYYFAAMGYTSNLYNLGKIVSEIMEQQKTRIEKAMNPTKTVVLKRSGLETTIEKFMEDSKVKFCKISVDDQKKSMYVVNVGSDEKECEKDPAKVFDHLHSYFEILEIEKSLKCGKQPCDKSKTKQGFRLNFVFNPKLKNKADKNSHINGLYSSSYEFFTRYNFEYNDVLKMYLKRGLFHLGVLDIDVEEGVENHFVNQKVGQKPDKKTMRELMGQIIPVSGLLKSVGGSNNAIVNLQNKREKTELNLFSKMVDLEL